MKKNIFNNSHMLDWLKYFADNTDIDLQSVRIIDITRKNKNLIPMVEAHRYVMVFTDAGHDDIFYDMFNAGLGDCMVVYNEGSEPEGPVLQKKVNQMIDRGINAQAAMMILNPHARNTIKFGMSNREFAYGSVRYVGSEIRAVILSKLNLHDRKNMCIISGESIAVEAAMMAGYGTVIAVEYSGRDRETMEENIRQFGLNNVVIIDHVDGESMKGLPVPDVTMLVASASMEQEIKYMLSVNPEMEFVIYTLDFSVVGGISDLLYGLGVRDIDITQIFVSKLTPKNMFEAQPAPWLITGHGAGI